MTHTRRKTRKGILVDSEGKLVTEMTDKFRTWKHSIQTTFSDDRSELYVSEEPEPYPSQITLLSLQAA